VGYERYQQSYESFQGTKGDGTSQASFADQLHLDFETMMHFVEMLIGSDTSMT
jgi:hypothetical protein